MLIGEPPRTQADLNFVLFGVPVRIHPFFWVISILLGLNSGDGQDSGDATSLLTWIVVIFVSILVHEFGHAVAIRYFGWRPWITLYAMGGLASHHQDHSPNAGRPSVQIIISLAGPAAGFVLAGIVIATLYLTEHSTDFMGVEIGTGDPIFRDKIRYLVIQLLWVNIMWGLVNLLPVYPLDGGQVAREIFTLFGARQGIVNSLKLSVITAAAMAAVGLFHFGSFYIALMFGFLAYSSYQALQAYSGRGGYGGGRPW